MVHRHYRSWPFLLVSMKQQMDEMAQYPFHHKQQIDSQQEPKRKLIFHLKPSL